MTIKNHSPELLDKIIDGGPSKRLQESRPDEVLPGRPSRMKAFVSNLVLMFRTKPCSHTDYWYQIGDGKTECQMCGKRFHRMKF